MSLTESPTSPTPGSLRGAPAAPADRWDWTLTLLILIGVASIVVAIAQAPAAVAQLYRDADSATGLVLPQLATHLPAGATINLGDHTWYEAWWFMRATAGLPEHRVIWESAPYVLAFLGIGGISWTVRMALGGRAAVLTAVALLAIGNGMRVIMFEPGARVGMLAHMALLLGALLWLAGRIGSEGASRRIVLGGGALAGVTALGATDQLTLYETVVPFAAAALVWWWRARSPTARLLAIWAIAVAAASIVAAEALVHVMTDAGVVASNSVSSYRFVPTNEIVPSVGNLLDTWTGLGDGDFFGAVIKHAALVSLVLGLLSLAALAGALRFTWRTARGWFEFRPSRVIADRSEVTDGRRTLFVTFWCVALAIALAADVLTTLWRAGSGRFLLGGWAAVAALLAMLATSPRGRAATAAAVALFALMILGLNVKDGVAPNTASYTAAEVSGISRFVESHGARVGYSGFWSASNFTLADDFREDVFPVWKCSPSTTRICYQPFANISSSYIPRPGVRTFLITGPAIDVLTPTVAPAYLGRPIASATFGSYTVSVYARDLADALGRE
jgi:hypothetical protein